MNRRTFLSMAGTSALSLVVVGPSAASPRPDIVGVVAATPELSTLGSALTAAGLTDLLKGTGPFTLFAPTNTAFAKLPAGTLDMLMQPENQDKLVAVLANHVVNRKMTILSMIEKTQDIPTLGGRMLHTTANMDVNVNGVHVIQPELLASNGVVHRIDTVLLPKT